MESRLSLRERTSFRGAKGDHRTVNSRTVRSELSRERGSNPMKQASGRLPEACGVLWGCGRSRSGYHPAYAGRSPGLPSRRQFRWGRITIDRGRLVLMLVFVLRVVPVFRGGMRSVMCGSPVAVAAGLLVAGIDVPAAGTDAAIEKRKILVRIAVAAIRAAGVALMIVGERWMRSEVEPTATARPLTTRVTCPQPVQMRRSSEQPSSKAASRQPPRISGRGGWTYP